MSRESVSVLIPVHNAERWLGDTLRSVLAQTWRELEIVVADDGSGDRSLYIANAFACERVRVLALRRGGAAAARNAAIDAARGDWLQFLDADDLLAPDKIERQMAALAAAASERPALATSAWAPFVQRPGDTRARPDALWRDLSPLDWLLAKFEHNAFMFPATWLASRTLVERAGRWNEALSLDDDGEFMCRLVAASGGVRFVGEAMSYRRIGNAGSLSSQKSARALRSGWTSMQLCIARLLSIEDSARTRRACLRYLQDNLVQFHPEAPSICADCRALARRLGGELHEPQESAHFRAVRRLVGWQRAKRWRAQLNEWRWGTRRLAARLGAPAP